MLRMRTLLRPVLILILLAHVVHAQSQSDQTLTNDDVIRMVRAQVSTAVIIAAIRDANVRFDLSPTGLIALKDANVGDQIIQAMQDRVRARSSGTDAVTLGAPEKSDRLAATKDRESL